MGRRAKLKRARNPLHPLNVTSGTVIKTSDGPIRFDPRKATRADREFVWQMYRAEQARRANIRRDERNGRHTP